LKLYSTSKIDLDNLFNSDQEVNAYLYIKRNGKQQFAIKQVKLNSLRTYLGSCQLIVHKILEHQNLKNTNWLVNLPCTTIDALIGSRKRITSTHLLVELGIIEVNHSYNHSAYFHFKQFSKSYRIEDSYTGDIVTVEGCITLRTPSNPRVNECGVLDRSIHDEGCITLNGYSQLGNTTSNTPIVIHPCYLQYQIRNLSSLRYDKVRAIEFLENNTFKSTELIRSQINEIETLNKISIGKKTGKVFTIINRIKREFRQFVTDDSNNPLHEVDFATSHLNHLIKVIRDDIKSGEYTPMFTVEYFSKEMIDFKQKVLAEDFYMYVLKSFNREFKTTINRDKAKSFVMYWLNSGYQNWKGVKFLRTRFPQITHYIDTVNIRDRRVLGNKLQRSEAFMLNERIINRLAIEHPESTSFTIFDGILIEDKYLVALLEIIKSESTNYLGFEAKVKIKNASMVVVPKTDTIADMSNVKPSTDDGSEFHIDEDEQGYYDFFISRLKESNNEILSQPIKLHSMFKAVMKEFRIGLQNLNNFSSQ